jgi:hypothetical protein
MGDAVLGRFHGGGLAPERILLERRQIISEQTLLVSVC